MPSISLMMDFSFSSFSRRSWLFTIRCVRCAARQAAIAAAVLGAATIRAGTIAFQSSFHCNGGTYWNTDENGSVGCLVLHSQATRQGSRAAPDNRKGTLLMAYKSLYSKEKLA